ncbi:MAG: LCP family protein, partial [Microgenomates group bacterium]
MNNKLYTYFVFAGIFLIGFLSTYAFLTLKTKKEAVKEIQEAVKENVVSGAPEVNQNSNSYNILLLGSGGGGHSGGGLTDSIIVVHIDLENKKVLLMSIPRDLWVPGNYKINASVVNVGLTNFKGTIQNITSLPISYFISVDFSG